MLRQRLLAVLIMLPVGMLFIVLGGWPYTVFIAFVLAAAALELVKIFNVGKYSPSRLVLLPGVVLLSLARAWLGVSGSVWLLCALVLAAMLYHIVRYEQGVNTAGIDLMITLGGLVYLGWIGAYLVSLRWLENGMWWLMLFIFTIALGDSGAYFIGRALGKHKLSPRVSPNKTWEGYLGGVLTAVLGGLGLAALFHTRVAAITLPVGAAAGLILGILAPLGDLGESLIKRQFGLKDSGRMLPGHGGFFDRIDSWLWAAVIGYYLVSWLW